MLSIIDYKEVRQKMMPDLAYASDVAIGRQEVVALQQFNCTTDYCAEALYVCENFAVDTELCLRSQNREMCIPCLYY